jgi:capsid assembly protease
MRPFPIYGAGLLALSAGSLTALAAGAPTAKPPGNEDRGEVAVVNVRGPLVHHVDGEFDSYDEIKERVALALQSDARAVVLRIDSPGGLVSGCFDTAVELRRMAARSGRRLIAYAEQATSAAYALACACEEIYASSSATVGSVGVIDTVLDVTSLDQAQGVKLALVTSGARKADSNPHTPLSDEKLAAAQASVDAVAGLFFELVADARRLGVGAVQALEAATFPGVVAATRGLVDHVATIEECIEAVARAPLTFSDTVRKLRAFAASSSNDPNERARVQRALRVLDHALAR